MKDLPPRWMSGALSDFVRPNKDKVSPANFPDLPFVGMDHVEAHTTRIIGSVPAGSMKSNAARFSRNDVLYGRLRPYLNKVAQPRFDGLASAEFIVFRGNEAIDPAFLRYRLNARDFVSFASHLNEGDRPRVSSKQIGNFNILLPPPGEQRRIVEKIEAMFDEIEKGVESLRAAKSTLDLYRKSLLKAAFEGRLTADWRARNPDKLVSPVDLLAHIRQEREERYQAALEDWREAVSHWVASREMGKKPAKPKRLLPLADMANCPKRAATPPEWVWLRLAGLGTVNGGLTKNQGRNSFPLKAAYLRVANVYTNRLELDEIKQIGVTQDELRRTRLVPGDLLFVEGNGSIGQIGRVALWDGSIPDMTHQNHLIRFSTDGFLLQRFALLFCMSPEGRKLITTQASSTSGLHTLSISKVQALPVPICAPDEQAEVVRLLDLELDAADTLEAEIGAGLARAEALRQSILKEAFAGRLVPQNPHDESASDLLGRIGAAHRSDHNRTRQQEESA